MSKLVFPQVVKQGPFETLSFSDLIRRPEAPNSLEPIHAALGAGDLVAYVQLEDGPSFYRVPTEHWRQPNPLLEGEPGDHLFCWGSSDVPAKFHDKPLLFFADEVAKWEENKGLAAVDAILAPEVDAFASTIIAGQAPREGYWEPFTALLWIATRDDAVVSAMQRFEAERQASAGGLHSNAVALLADSFLFTRFGIPLAVAFDALVEAMQCNKLAGVVADDRATGRMEEVPRHAWADAKIVHHNWGLQLAHGYTNFRFPSDEVRRCFPFVALAQPKPAEEHVTVVTATGAGIKDCRAWLLKQFQDQTTKGKSKAAMWREAESLFPDRISNRAFRAIWSELAKDFPERSLRGAKPKLKTP